ncbi:MAG: tripartite tricarboxylate transporter substrate binding protein [Nitrincola sp.]|nr:tripartite tricarboxylate transporter substrate binding protein [Nitrincola sp.]
MKKPAALFGLLMLLVALSSSANTFPSKPLALLIGFDRGGTIYTQAETLAEVLADILNQPVGLEVRSGLGGGLAASMVANSQAEGYIMLFTTSVPITNAPNNVVDSFQVNDFRYIGAISEDQNAFVTSSDSPFSNWVEFVDYARQKDEILYASQNITDRHFINNIAQQEGFNVRIIPVSGGAGMAPLVLGRDVDLAFSGGTHNRYVDSGEMKVLASTSRNRLMEHPEVPTLIELGYELDMQSLRILAVPKNTPDEQFDILSQALSKAIEDPRLVEVIHNVIRHPVTMLSDQELQQFITDRRSQYLELLSTLDNER